ncbi:MAG: gfo/Idh/MocA family oxidoreductase, partial [Gemmatimonadales bacterium]
GDVAAHHSHVLGRLDGAILATPHHLHVPIALELVDAGVPVLSEKPLGVSVAEIRELRDRAAAAGVAVAVNQTRRFIPACQEIKRILDAGELGDLVRVEMAEGDKFGWPAATPSMFGARSGGRGVLLDIGVHALDLAVWWLGEGLAVDTYQDDSLGGSEAAVRATFHREDLTVELRLSWLARQANRYTFQGSRGTLEWSIYDLDRVRIRRNAAANPEVRRIRGAPGAFADLAPRVVENFLAAASGPTPPVASVEDALASMALIEGCYARRERLAMPWHAFQMEPAHVR